MPLKISHILISLAVIYPAILQAQSSLLPFNNDLAKSFTTKDTLFKEPYIDKDEWRDAPVRHRYVHGGFKGTNARFSFYFPSKEKYRGRFFQYITPAPDNENLSQGAAGEEDKIGFSVTHGAYFIETNEGGATDFSRPEFRDATIAAYRANAAAAQFSRIVSAQIYGNKRPYGYAFGGSGGAYRTLGGIESTEGVWDGVVPYVMGSPMAIPNGFTVRMYAMRVLHDKLPQIIDALEPGGSGDPYAGLNDEEKAVLLEVTKMGFPPQSWYGYKTMGIHGFLVLYQGVVASDRKYFTEDFWNKPGYLGYNPPASLLKARIQQATRIKLGISRDQAISMGLYQMMSPTERGTADASWKAMGMQDSTIPVAFQLQDVMPDVNFLGGDLIIRSGDAAGKTLQVSKVFGDRIILGPADPKVIVQLKSGDEVQVDNSNFLAAQTYHRHQIPGKEYYVYDQFRDKDGAPIYPQRSMLLGPRFTVSAAGVLPKGKFNGKMIVLESLWDREALPWQADWYRSRVKENLGDSIDSYFRLWYTDHALHGDIAVEDDPTHTISYLGVLQQALLDLSAWVEKGIAPAATTNYKIVDGQVVVPPTAQERKGIQPVVTVKANGGKRADVKVGRPVTFTAVVEVPKGMGKVVAASWNFEGLPNDIGRTSGWNFETSNVFPVKATMTPTDKSGLRVTLKTTYTFTKPGTYFPTLRVASQREGDAKTLFTRIQNLDRVRVVVEQDTMATSAHSQARHRLIVVTDIGNEPDDFMSMVRLMLYSNQIDIEGLIASTSIHQSKKVSPDLIQKVINAYGKVQPNLSKHEPGYPTSQKLLSLLKRGLPVYGMEGVGKGRDSEGSEWIIKMLEKNDHRPLWVAVWGGPNTVAQALWKVRESKSEAEAKRLISKLRVYTISDQDNTGPWIRKNFPDLFYIASPGSYDAATWSAINKVFPGANNEVVSNDWLLEHVQQGHGPLGEIYPDVAFGMEGDTPSWLSLIPNGLNEPEHPNWGGWGGRYELYKPPFDPKKRWIVPLEEETRPFWTNAEDEYTPWLRGKWGRAVVKDTATYKSNHVTLWRWREEFQNDFAARMDWCTKDYKHANHPPVVRLNVPEQITVKAGDTFRLDGSSSYDPDGDGLSYLWFQYPEVGTLRRKVTIQPANNMSVIPEVRAPQVDSPQTTHFILKVTDKGTPRLTRYKRVIVTIVP